MERVFKKSVKRVKIAYTGQSSIVRCVNCGRALISELKIANNDAGKKRFLRNQVIMICALKRKTHYSRSKKWLKYKNNQSILQPAFGQESFILIY
jgi:hypothetical protein